MTNLYELPHEPSEENPVQEIILETADDFFKEYFTSTKGRYHMGPARIRVYWHPDGIDVIIRALEKEK